MQAGVCPPKSAATCVLRAHVAMLIYRHTHGVLAAAAAHPRAGRKRAAEGRGSAPPAKRPTMVGARGQQLVAMVSTHQLAAQPQRVRSAYRQAGAVTVLDLAQPVRAPQEKLLFMQLFQQHQPKSSVSWQRPSIWKATVADRGRRRRQQRQHH